MKTPVSANARAGLQTFGSVHSHLVDSAEAAAGLQFAAVRTQSEAALACAEAIAKADPTDLPRVMFERGAAFMQESFERAVRLGQDLLALGQKTGSAVQASVQTQAA